MELTTSKLTGILATMLLGLAVFAAVAGCTGKAREPFRDAPASSHNSAPAEVIEMPDGFSNLADKCDGHGHRVYVVFHGDSSYGAITAISDPTCAGGMTTGSMNGR